MLKKHKKNLKAITLNILISKKRKDYLYKIKQLLFCLFLFILVFCWFSFRITKQSLLSLLLCLITI